MLIYLTEGLAFGLPAAAQPGPFQAYLLAQTMRNGWRRTMPAALAPLLSDGPIILVVLLILTRLPDIALRGIQLAGGLFILFLAWRAFQTWRAGDFNLGEAELAGAHQSILEAGLMNFLNPNPYLFWGLVGGPLLLEGWRANPVYALAFLLGFYGTLIGGFALFIYLFGAARRLGPRVSKALTLVSAVALFAFGVYQLVEGVS